MRTVTEARDFLRQQYGRTAAEVAAGYALGNEAGPAREYWRQVRQAIEAADLREMHAAALRVATPAQVRQALADGALCRCGSCFCCYVRQSGAVC